MESHADPNRPASSLELARERDARVLWLLGEHPVTAAHLVALGWFPGKNKALARLRRLVRRKRIQLVGTLSRRGGRPEHVYCRWRPRPETLLHEIELTEVCLGLHATAIRRGPGVLDRTVLPDAEVVIGGDVYYLELDRGTMSHAQLARRFRAYEGCPHLSLWICSTHARREALRVQATALRGTALFATFQEALASPHGPIWHDVSGGVASLPVSTPPASESARSNSSDATGRPSNEADRPKRFANGE